VKTLTLAEWNDTCRAQGVPRLHVSLKCCMCGTVQCMADFIAAGLDEEAAGRQLGFSCIGRHTGAGAHERGAAPGNGCNWTLGGLFRLHTLEVITENGTVATFEPATPEEAQAHLRGELPKPALAITRARLHVLQHSIGADQYGRIVRGGGRNHFVTGEGSIDHRHCMVLVAAGLMTRRAGSAISGGDDIFTVTDAG
jgi:hypothetical protein